MVRGTDNNLRAFGKFATTIVALTALATSLIFAQGATATMSGVVHDGTGGVIPGVTVTIKHTETGLTRTVQTAEDGGYRMPSLPVGAYEVTAEAAGFKRQVRSGVNLVVAQEAVVNLTLEVGGVTEQVIVSEDAPLVNTTLAETSGLINEGQIKNLPLNGRSFDQLLTMNVGVSNNSSNTLNNQWTAFSVSGKRPETNRFVINGIDYVGGNAGGLFVTPSGAGGQLLGVDAVREYNVLSHSYGAEYGKRAGGQISIVPTSGTNQWHGSAFEFLRNSALDTRNFFDDVKGPFKRNQFGGTLGGPIKKDKLFLFGNYEGFQQRLALSQIAIVPDNCARQGLTSIASGACGGPVTNLKPAMLPYVNSFWPAPNREPFLFNGQATGAARYFSNAPQAVRENFGLVRFDYVASTKDSFSTTYTIDRGRRDVSQPDPVFVQIAELRPTTIGLQETHVFSATLLNTATVGFSRNYATQVVAARVAIPASLVFLAGGNPGSIIIGGGAVTVVSSAFTPANGGNPQAQARNYYTWSDDLHLTGGKHSWSAGVWVQRIHQNTAGSGQASGGNVAYPTVLAMLQDQPSQFILNRNPIPVGFRTTEGAWYLQDEMKLKSNLTLRLGLRHEMTDGWNEVAGRCSNFRWDQNFVISTNPVVGKSCLDRNNAKLLLQPRVGLAWDPTGTGTWAVRAGFGIHNDLQDNLSIRIHANPPTNAREQFIAPLLSLIPLQKAMLPPPTCGPAVPQPCSIYTPAGVDPNMFTPTVQEWSLTVEREITKDMMLQLSYVGSQSYHTNVTQNVNVAPPLVCQDPQGCISGGTTVGGTPVSQTAVVPQGTLYMAPGRRPNTYVATGVGYFNQGTASYHSLNASLVKRATRGLTFKTNYTYGKVLDLNSALLAPAGENEPPAIISPYIRYRNKGVASFSLLHQFNASYSYQLPLGNGQRFASGSTGWVNQLVGGWQWNGIFTAQSGFPFTPLVGSNPSGTGDSSQSDVPNWNPNFKGPVILGKPDQWFDPMAFMMPTAGTFGNVSRGSLRGPRLVDFDTSLFKKFTVNEKLNLQFRAEAFNVFNHANFASPNQIVFSGTGISPSAGVIEQTATTSRQIQFALKVMF